MTFAQEIAEYLEDLSIGTVGTTLFYGRLPDTQASTTMAAIIDHGGPPPPAEIPNRDVLLQVMVRATTYDLARTFAGKIHNILHGLIAVDVGDNTVQGSRAMGLPAYIGPDTNGRELISGNYVFHTVANTASGQPSSGYQGDKDPNLN